VSRIVLPAEPLIESTTALRPWREEDLPALVAACQDPEIPRWTRVPSPYGESDARQYLHGRFDAIRSGSSAPYAIVEAHDDRRLLGAIGLLAINWPNRRAEVGYWLAREARGSGHATRAVRLICDWGLRSLGIERIGLLAATGNRASQRVAERAGFSREGVLRSYMPSWGDRHDMVAYALLGGD
jgi:RimJ/RimL family protein N-acetyltransferase